MNPDVLQQPKFIWKTPPGDSMTKRMKMIRAMNPAHFGMPSAAGVGQPQEMVMKMQIGENNLKPISYLEQGLVVSRTVAKITCESDYKGTGFLIAPDILMTNFHVFPTEEIASNATIQFNYQKDIDGKVLQTGDYVGNPASLYYCNQDLDYVVVRLKWKSGLKEKWGVSELKSVAVNLDDKVNIIQHPNGDYKQVAMNDNEVRHVDQDMIQYLTDTEGCSSGSPVFNEQWQVVALHHSSKNESHPFGNEGIKISAIIKDMPSNLRDMMGVQI
jgi:V8-like Glu-specific endopeptidase